MISRIKKIALVHFLTIVFFTLLISPSQTFAARLWSSGFELGTTTNDVEYNEWIAPGAIDTTTVRTGTYSLKIALTGSSSRRGGYVIPNEYGTVQFYRAYVRFETFPTAANSFMVTGNADATRQIFVKVDNAGQLSLVDEDGSIGTGSTLSLNTWYRLELEIDTSGAGATDTVNLYLDGTLNIGSSTRDISKVQDQFYFVGNGGAEAHTTGVWYFDDIAANSNSGSVQNGLPGAGGILHMQPDSAGDAAATAGLFSAIDEVTPNDVTDYIEVDTNTGGQQANYNFESWASAGGASNDSITLVQVGTRQTMETAVAGAWTPQIKSQSSGTTTSGTSTSQNDTTWQTNFDSTFKRNYQLTSYTDPQAGGAWTPALLDTMIAGVNVTDGNPDNWFSTIWGLVEYAPTTTLGDGTDGSNSTIGPGASATEIDRFSLATSSGTDTVTGMTVTLAGDASAYTNIATVGVYTTADALKCSATPSANAVALTTCAIDVTTTPTDYVVKITPKTHANMPAVPGASYATTATVTAITATNTTAGTDTDSATITVDNASPGAVASSTVTAGNTIVDLAWTNPSSVDSSFTTGGTVVVLRRETSVVTDVPVEGTTYTVGNIINTVNTVACVVTGSPPATTCQDTGLTNGTAYYYKIFTEDSYGNYDAGTVPTGSPATPVGATFSGTVYTDEGTTLMTTGPTVALRVNGGGTYSAVANGSGVYSIPNVTVSAGQVVSIFLDTNAGNQANLITRAASGGNVSGLNLYQNRVIVSHEDAGPITNANLDQFDNVGDSDMMFTVTTNDAVYEDGAKVIIWTGKTYTPGGTVTTDPSASSSSVDGDLTIQTSAILAMGTNALSVGGDFVNSGTFSESGSPQVTTFTATATGHTIDNGTGNLDNVTFNGVGGGWSFADASNTIAGDITMTAGTLSGTNSITVNGGDVTGDGTINLTGGTFLLDGAGNFGGATAWTFSSLTLGDGTGATASTATGTGGITATGVLTIALNQTLNAGSKTWTLSGSGTPLVTTGTFTAGMSTFQYTSTSATNVANTTFYNLSLIPAGIVTYTLGTGTSQTITVDGVLTIGDGTNALTANANTYNPTLNIKTTLIATGSTLSAPASLNLSGNLTNNGTFTHNSGTVTLTPGSPYQYYRTITIDKTKVPNTDQTNFPVLISGTYSYLATVANGGLVQNANGYDVAFFSDLTLTTQLKHETERYIATTGEVIYWVKVPTVATATDTVIYMAYGNSSVTADQSDKTNVWDSNYKGVWHLPDGTTLGALDSTTSMINGTVSNATAISAKIDGGANFNGSTAIINTNASTDINNLTNITVEEWLYVTAFTNSFGSGLGKTNAAGDLGWLSIARSTRTNFEFFRSFSGTDGQWGTGAASVATGQWYHFAVTHNGSLTIPTFYLNGNLVASPNTVTTPTGSLDADSTLTLSMGGNGVSTFYFNGGIDEARVSNVIRSADWITTEYNNQNSPSTFYSVGSEVASGTITTIGGASNITFNNFTVSAANGAGKFLKFKAGNTYTFAGTFDIAGQSGNILAVSSDTASSQWTTTFSSTATVSYISVKDSACSGGNNVDSTFTTVNLGNNGSCWTANIVSRGGGGGGVEASATPDAQVGAGAGSPDGGTGGAESGGTPDPGVGGGGAGDGGGGDSGALPASRQFAGAGASDATIPVAFTLTLGIVIGAATIIRRKRE
ncbi:MAG: DUF2341 domain-containing protein [Patescibacteria group bacterium]